ncbi:hypothetical protein evm_000743 [Chilo suppressalis]|nr:hypothetical protein evm_000743 [Chilo suppressalis]
MGAIINFFLISFFIKCVLCSDALFDACSHSDIECLQKAVASFFNKTSCGIHELGIKQVDPLIFYDVEYVDPGSDIVVCFLRTEIEGLKDMKLNHLQMDTDTKSEVFQTRFDVNIETFLTVELKEADKYVSGTFKAKATGLATAKFSYEMKPNSAGVEHFDIGPETFTCEEIEVTQIILDQHFADVIANYPAGRVNYQRRAEIIRKPAICTFIEKAYRIVISNIRAATIAFPKTAFFTDL